MLRNGDVFHLDFPDSGASAANSRSSRLYSRETPRKHIDLIFVLGIGGLADFTGKDLTLTSSTASALQNAFTVEGVLLLVSGYGVWSMRNWGFRLTVAIALLGLATSLAALALQSSFSIVGIIANIAILVYASRPPVRAYFTSTTGTSA